MLLARWVVHKTGVHVFGYEMLTIWIEIWHFCYTCEAFQGVWATSDVVSKCGDNLLPKYQQLTEVDMKGVTICENDNPFFISTKRQLQFFSSTVTWLSWHGKTSRSSIVCIYGRSVVQILTETNRHSTLFTKS